MKLSLSKYTAIGISLVALTSMFSSCSKFLNVDKYFDDEFKIDSVYVNVRYMEAYMWGAAAMFPDEAATIRYNYTPGIMATDEAFNGLTGPGVGNVYFGIDFATGFTTPDYYGTSSNNMDKWPVYYKIIRKCNNILTHIDEPKDMTTTDHITIEGYTRFIRAYAYYNILHDYGPPIILGDEVVNTNETLEYYDRPRVTYDSAVDYICGEFDAAAKFLPSEVSILDFGKPTKGAALALIARLRLIHASPLYNGGSAAHSYFANWVRSGTGKGAGEHYVSQTYDERRWAVAAAAAKRVMELTGSAGPLYRLYTVPADEETPALPTGVTSDPNYYGTFPNGAAGIDPYHSYKDMFDGEAVASINPEFIWAKNSAYINDYYLQGTIPPSMGGWGRYCVTQKVIDAYLMDDGRTIQDASSDGYYSEEGFTKSTKHFSGYTLNSDVYNMYNNREMRFYASVGFNQAIWPALSSINNNNHTADYFYQGADGRGGVTAVSPNYPITGYVSNKWQNPMDAKNGTGARTLPKAYAIIRYAEILLSYAEALNNLTTSYTIDVDGNGKEETFSRNTEEIRSAFNKVRYRAGLPGLSDAQLASRDEVQKAIERERMVEFLWENRRYYDVRRWGIYEQTEREPVTGMNADGATKDTYYKRVIPGTSRIRGRIVDKKLNWLPIPRRELNRLPSLDQNPGW